MDWYHEKVSSTLGIKDERQAKVASYIVLIVVVILIVVLVLMVLSWVFSFKRHKHHHKPDPPDPPAQCNIPATTPAPPTQIIGTCPNVSALYQLSSNGQSLLTKLSIPANANVLVMIHGFGASSLSLVPLGNVFNKAVNPNTSAGYYDAVLFYEYNAFYCTVESIAGNLLTLLKKQVPSSATLDFAGHSLGGMVGRWLIEQLDVGASFAVNAYYMFEAANYCVPDTLTAPITPLAIETLAGGVLLNDPLCLQALTPEVVNENGGAACNVGNAGNKPLLWATINSTSASPVSSTVKYFAVGGDVPSDGLLGWPAAVGDAIALLYLSLGDGTCDGILSTDGCHGTGVLEVKSDFLASYGAPPNAVRPTLPHDHLTMVGLSVLSVSPLRLGPGIVPSDVQEMVGDWLALAYPA
jgi:hypothetical protein